MTPLGFRPTGGQWPLILTFPIKRATNYTRSLEMNGNYRRFMHLISAATTGLLQQIPGVGPVLQSVLTEMQQQRILAALQRLAHLLEAGANLTTDKITDEQLEDDLSVIVQDG